MRRRRGCGSVSAAGVIDASAAQHEMVCFITTGHLPACMRAVECLEACSCLLHPAQCPPTAVPVNRPTPSLPFLFAGEPG